uniref:SCP domain-containing protein n=1 Tax=Rhabditophanes sp. KR3021 TaxID=114890 RepID=A0AC35U369_9BILA
MKFTCILVTLALVGQLSAQAIVHYKNSNGTESPNVGQLTDASTASTAPAGSAADDVYQASVGTCKGSYADANTASNAAYNTSIAAAAPLNVSGNGSDLAYKAAVATAVAVYNNAFGTTVTVYNNCINAAAAVANSS